VSHALSALAGLNVFAEVGRVVMIGKPRKPVTREDAIASIVFCTAVAAILVIAAMRIGSPIAPGEISRLGDYPRAALQG
jgi:uncharacterized membrane protein YbhN (UPF0104 family)